MGLFGKKQKPVEKPNRIKIQLALDKCKDSIKGLLSQYETTIDGYQNKMVNLKKEGRNMEAETYKNKLKMVLNRRIKMQDLMDKIEQFEFMIDEAFAKNQVYQTMGLVLGEANKMSVSPELKSIFKQMNTFQDIFTEGLGKLDNVFGKISKSIEDVDQSTSNAQDAEIDEIVNRQLEQYDQETTRKAEEGSLNFDVFN